MKQTQFTLTVAQDYVKVADAGSDHVTIYIRDTVGQNPANFYDVTFSDVVPNPSVNSTLSPGMKQIKITKPVNDVYVRLRAGSDSDINVFVSDRCDEAIEFVF